MDQLHVHHLLGDGTEIRIQRVEHVRQLSGTANRQNVTETDEGASHVFELFSSSSSLSSPIIVAGQTGRHVTTGDAARKVRDDRG